MNSSFKFSLWLKALLKKIITTTLNLFKVMIPILLLVKIIEELGWIASVAQALAPVMALVGLPPEMGLVWASTMISSIYGGMIIFVSLPASESLTVAQVTVMSVMMLFAHSMLIETAVAKKSGVTIIASLVLRIGSALVAGMILNEYYLAADILQETNIALWEAGVQPENLEQWAIQQVETLAKIVLIIAVLVTFLDLLKLSGSFLKPLLKNQE